MFYLEDYMLDVIPKEEIEQALLISKSKPDSIRENLNCTKSSSLMMVSNTSELFGESLIKYAIQIQLKKTFEDQTGGSITLEKHFDSNQISIKVFIDEVRSVVLKHNLKVRNQIEQAKHFSNLNTDYFYGHNVPTKVFWQAIIEYTKTTVDDNIALARKIPGISDLATNDDDKIFALMMNDHLLDYYVVGY
jgi:hypothetical protein